MKYLFKLLVPITIILGLSSCEQFLDIDSPVNEIASEAVFDSKATIEATVVGLYGQMTFSNNYALNGFLSVYAGLSADDLRNSSTASNLEQFRSNELLSTNPLLLNNLWRALYNYVYHANAVLEGLRTTTVLNHSENRAYQGEMLFARALSYFYLINLFGDVPLVLTTNYESNRRLGRAGIAEVYQQITEDLLLAEDYVAVQYPSNQHVRPNKMAVKAFLARVYLYNSQYEKAELKASEVIESGLYHLEDALENVFLPGSSEAIWQLYPANVSFNSSEGFAFIPASATARPAYFLTDQLLNAFEPNDKRREAWTMNRTSAGTLYVFPYKYKVRSSIEKIEYNTVFRLSEQFLIRAEARAMFGSTEGALADINVIRIRAGLNEIPEGLSQQECLKAITQENRIEFFAEWGHRWLDLKRTGSADAILGAIKESWEPGDVVYPIPQVEIDRNPSLSNLD